MITRQEIKNKINAIWDFVVCQKKWFLLAGFLVVILGIGVFLAKDSISGVLFSQKQFLGALFAIEKDDLFASSASLKVVSSSAPVAKECSFETSDSPSHDTLILNEIAWMGNLESTNNEWIELKNISSEILDIGGFNLVNQNEKIRIIFKNSAKIPAGGFYLLERGGADFLPGVKADDFYTGALKNTGDSLRLFNNNCRLIDQVLATSGWPAGDNKTKKTMERVSATFAWHTSGVKGGTPKKDLPAEVLAQAGNTLSQKPSQSSANSESDPIVQAATPPQSTIIPPPTTNPASAEAPAYAEDSAGRAGKQNQSAQANTAMTPPSANQESSVSPPQSWCSSNSPKTLSYAVLINEVAWAGTASNSTTHEWVELKNNSDSSISMQGWQLQNASQNIKVLFESSDLIEAGGFYLLKRGGSDFLPGIKADKFFTNAIKNNGEALYLFDNHCNIVDEIIANAESDKNWLAGTTGPDYRTAERSPDLSWHTYSGNGSTNLPQVFGTPRAENLAPVISVVEPPLVPATPPPPPPPLPPAPIYYTLQISKSGTGSGSVTSDSSGIICGSSCFEDSKDFTESTPIILTAAASDGSEFTGWSGDCSGNNSCAVVMNSNTSVNAIFNQIPPPPPPAALNVDHLVISEVQAAGADSSDQFIKLYNPTTTDVDLSGWSIQYRGPNATLFSKKNFDSGKKISAGEYFLIARGLDADGSDGYRGDLNGDYMTHRTFKLGISGGTIFLISSITLLSDGNDSTIVDKIAYGTGSYLFPESSAFTLAPSANHSIKRKFADNLIQDTNDNAADFELN
ncbi:lamin tail domain-containing protein [Candidatus Nomurabacteria bacterium]|nr:lamin tail domain-containing protein [Candidatus Nomurabacteria bacterium]